VYAEQAGLARFDRAEALPSSGERSTVSLERHAPPKKDSTKFCASAAYLDIQY
jgi:hypothetical protein